MKDNTKNKYEGCDHPHNHEHNHNHSHGHMHTHHHGGDNIGSAFFINALFTVIEIFGGLFTNSTAILSDAIHDLGDTISLALAWILEKKSALPESNKFTYGYSRYSVIGSLINIVILSIGTFVVLINSIPRLFNPEPVNSQGMLILSIIGVIMNGIAILKVKDGNKTSEKVATLHLLEDVLGWMSVLVVSVIMLFIDLPILDPMLSIGISIYMIKNIISNTKIILNILLQSVPYGIEIENIKSDILSLSEDIEDVLNIKCWSLDGESNVITVELEVSNLNIYIRLKPEIDNILKSRYNAKYTNISVK